MVKDKVNLMENVKKVPLRMCVVCRQHLPKRELIKVCKNKSGDFALDTTYKKEGRGAYVCKSVECLSKLEKSRGFNRAYKCMVPNEIYDSVKGELETLDKTRK